MKHFARLLFASVLVLGAAAAHAVPITIGIGGPNPFQVDPLYFIPPTQGNENPFGLDGPGNGVDFAVPSQASAISACGAPTCDLSVSISLQRPILQNPQFPSRSVNPQVPQGAPTMAVPIVADSTWIVRNNTGASITGAYLLFTSVDFGGFLDVPVALDQNIYLVASVGSGVEEAFYGALALGNLAADEERTLTIRYIVAGSLRIDRTDPENPELVVPRFGVTGLINVPEPTTLILVSLGLSAMGLVQRRRSA